jgi:hypothetical protein
MKAIGVLAEAIDTRGPSRRARLTSCFGERLPLPSNGWGRSFTQLFVGYRRSFALGGSASLVISRVGISRRKAIPFLGGTNSDCPFLPSIIQFCAASEHSSLLRGICWETAGKPPVIAGSQSARSGLRSVSRRVQLHPMVGSSCARAVRCCISVPNRYRSVSKASFCRMKSLVLTARERSSPES